MQPPEHRLGTRRAYTGRMLNVDVDTVRMPNDVVIDLEIVRHPGASAIVPLLSDPQAEDPEVLLLQQFRYAAGGIVWEIPAGVLEPGETPEACARRELLEETGARAHTLERLTTIYTTPGFTDERIHLFVASGLTVEATSHEADEVIQVEARPLSAALEMIQRGELVDGKTIVALLYLAGFRLGR